MTAFSNQSRSTPQAAPRPGFSTWLKRKLPLCWGWILAILLTILGFGLRLYDLTDQPLDFHSTRQLRGALIARHFLYHMLPDADADTRSLAYSLSRSTGQYEPPILENLVAWSYRLMGAENLWVSRIWTSVFWCIGGLFLFSLARKMAPGNNSSANLAALVSLGYYLFLPFAVQASRSFQPDPGMVMWVIISLYFFYAWGEASGSQAGNASITGRSAWSLAILAGLTGGMATLSKAVAVYIVAGAAVGIVLYTLGWRRAWRNIQVWTMAILLVLPSAIYYLFGREARAAGYLQSWTISLSHLLLDPAVYFRWFNLLVDLMGLFPLVLAAFGIALGGGKLTSEISVLTASGQMPSAQKSTAEYAFRNRAILIGVWIGYFGYGLTLPYQMYTHNYYHLQLVPIIAISLLPVFQILFQALADLRISTRHAPLWKALALSGLLVTMGYWTLTSIIKFNQEDFRDVPAYWEEIGSKLPTDGKFLGLTQDYGFPLAYYGWRKVTIWPVIGERQLAALRGREKGFEEFFNKRSEEKSYFLVTSFNQLDRQPDLKAHLSANYPVFAEGSGYLIYDLRNPLLETPSESTP
jgi:hypothetical protein